MHNGISMAKLLLRIALGKDFYVRPDVKCPTSRFGSAYGGWDVADGLLAAESVVYSFGVGKDVSFDIGLIDALDLEVHAFDPTPESIDWVKLQGLSEKFIMHGCGIAAVDGTVRFNPPENPAHISHTMLDRPGTSEQGIDVPVKKLSTIMKELGHAHIDLLKMDVEGAEYDVLKEMVSSGIRPDQLLVEFHHRFPNVGTQESKEAIHRIKSMGYRLFAVSSRNEEFCFIHERAIKSAGISDA